MSERLRNYLRFYRKKAGLNQRELGGILGYGGNASVGHHERSYSLPPLVIAVGYSIVFEVPLSELFAGLYEGVQASVEQRLSELERDLRHSRVRPLRRVMVARKLQWLSERQKTTRSI